MRFDVGLVINSVDAPLVAVQTICERSLIRTFGSTPVADEPPADLAHWDDHDVIVVQTTGAKPGHFINYRSRHRAVTLRAGPLVGDLYRLKAGRVFVPHGSSTTSLCRLAAVHPTIGFRPSGRA